MIISVIEIKRLTASEKLDTFEVAIQRNNDISRYEFSVFRDNSSQPTILGAVTPRDFYLDFGITSLAEKIVCKSLLAISTGEQVDLPIAFEEATPRGYGA